MFASELLVINPVFPGVAMGLRSIICRSPIAERKAIDRPDFTSDNYREMLSDFSLGDSETTPGSLR